MEHKTVILTGDYGKDFKQFEEIMGYILNLIRAKIIIAEKRNDFESIHEVNKMREELEQTVKGENMVGVLQSFNKYSDILNLRIEIKEG